MIANNIVGLTNNSLFESIELFLSIKRSKSENTYKSYYNFYKEFFMYVLNKELNELIWSDILKINYKNILMYRKYLLDKGNVNRTVNNKVIALRSLWRHLKRDNRDIDEFVLDIDPLNEITVDTRYGSLTQEELKALLDFCDKQKNKSLIKRLYFEFAFITTLRKQCILDLKWKNIKQKIDNKTGKKVWVVCSWDKGTEITKGITDGFYEKISLLKNLATNPNDNVFQISDKTLAKTLHEFVESHGIDKDRNIVLHSLKGTSIDKIWNDTKDILSCSAAANHKNPMTTYNTYIGKNKGITEGSSYTMYESVKGIEKLEVLSREELLGLIKKSKWVVNELIKNM